MAVFDELFKKNSCNDINALEDLESQLQSIQKQIDSIREWQTSELFPITDRPIDIDIVLAILYVLLYQKDHTCPEGDWFREKDLYEFVAYSKFLSIEVSLACADENFQYLVGIQISDILKYWQNKSFITLPFFDKESERYEEFIVKPGKLVHLVEALKKYVAIELKKRAGDEEKTESDNIGRPRLDLDLRRLMALAILKCLESFDKRTTTFTFKSHFMKKYNVAKNPWYDHELKCRNLSGIERFYASTLSALMRQPSPRSEIRGGCINKEYCTENGKQIYMSISDEGRIYLRELEREVVGQFV